MRRWRLPEAEPLTHNHRVRSRQRQHLNPQPWGPNPTVSPHSRVSSDSSLLPKPEGAGVERDRVCVCVCVCVCVWCTYVQECGISSTERRCGGGESVSMVTWNLNKTSYTAQITVALSIATPPPSDSLRQLTAGPSNLPVRF